MISRRQGLLVVLSGPSGVGKGTVIDAAFGSGAEGAACLRRSVSVTTRPRRPHEQEGVHYFFRGREAFARMQESGELLEWATYLDQQYGTPAEWVRRQLAAGYDVVLEIEVQGARQVRQSHPGAVLVYLLPPSWEELRRRLSGRGSDSPETQQRRIEVAGQEIAFLREGGCYDYIIVNDTVPKATKRFLSILEAEHWRADRLEVAGLTPEGTE